MAGCRSRPYWTHKLPTRNRAWPVVTPELSLSPVGVKAVWPRPKPCHRALFQQGESMDNSVQGPRISSQIRGGGVTPTTLPSWIPIAQSAGASVPPLHLPLTGQRIAFDEPCRGPCSFTCRVRAGQGAQRLLEKPPLPAPPAGHPSSEGSVTGAKPHRNRDFGTSLPPRWSAGGPWGHPILRDQYSR